MIHGRLLKMIRGLKGTLLKFYVQECQIVVNESAASLFVLKRGINE